MNTISSNLKCTLYRAQFLLIPQAYYYYQLRQSSLYITKATDYLKRSYQITKKLIETEQSIQQNTHLLSAMQENLHVFHKQLTYHYVIELGKQGKVMSAIIKAIGYPQVILDICL